MGQRHMVRGQAKRREAKGERSLPRPQATTRDENDPAVIKEMLAANPDQLAMLKQNNPRLAEAYDTGSVEEFGKVEYFSMSLNIF